MKSLESLREDVPREKLSPGTREDFLYCAVPILVAVMLKASRATPLDGAPLEYLYVRPPSSGVPRTQSDAA
jgi:hypothetical protein